MLSHSGCPEDLLESYLQFLQTEGQQVQIVRGEVFMMFEKEAQYRKRRNEKMKGTVTFCKKHEERYRGIQYRSVHWNGIYPMLLQPWDSCTGAECAKSTWGNDGDCRGVREVDERNTPIAELRPDNMWGQI